MHDQSLDGGILVGALGPGELGYDLIGLLKGMLRMDEDYGGMLVSDTDFSR